MGIIELMQGNPRISIAVFAFLVSFFISIIQKYFGNQKRLKEIRARQKELQQLMKENRDDHEKVMEFQKEMFSYVGESFKHSFKPLLITMIPILVFFWWLRGIFAPTEIAGTWIWYYIGFSMVFGMVLRKILRLA